MKKVGLFCSTMFHFYLYESIVKYISNEYFFITPIIDEHLKGKELHQFMSSKGYELHQEGEVINKQISIDIMISPYWRPSFDLYPSRIKMVRLMYGYAKDDWNYADWNKYYDLILSYGPYAQMQLTKYENSVAVGNPRIIKLKKREELDNIQDIKGRLLLNFINPSKETILYAPTWGDLSSYFEILPYLNELSNCFNIIIKAHHLLDINDEKEIQQLIRDFKIFYCDERVDIFCLLENANLLISDYSGAIFDGILVGVPVALVNNGKQFSARGKLEGIMREELKVISTLSISSCKNDIQFILSHGSFYREKVKILCENLFEYIEQPEKILLHIEKELLCQQFSSVGNLGNNKRNTVLSLLDRSQKFVICGCGEYGLSLLKLLEQHGQAVDFFIDNNKEESNYYGIPILNEKQFLMQDLSSVFHYIIATKSGAQYFNNLLKKKDVLKANITFL